MAEKKAPITEEEIKRVRAQSRFVRGSARKARVVLVHIRGKSVVQARAALQFTPRAAAKDILATLESAAANAEANHDLDPNDAARRGGLRRRGPDPQALAAACARPRHAHPQALLPPDRRPAARPQARGGRRGHRRAPGRGREGDDRGDAARTAHRQGRRARGCGRDRRARGRPETTEAPTPRSAAPKAAAEAPAATEETAAADEAVGRGGSRSRGSGRGSSTGRGSGRRGRERRRRVHAEGGGGLDGPEDPSRRAPRRHHPRVEVRLVLRARFRCVPRRGHSHPRAHPREAVARRALRHLHPQGQPADHDRHLHRASRHRDREVRQRGRRAAPRRARHDVEGRADQHQRDQAPRARRQAGRAGGRRAAAEPRVVPARDEALARLGDPLGRAGREDPVRRPPRRLRDVALRAVLGGSRAAAHAARRHRLRLLPGEDHVRRDRRQGLDQQGRDHARGLRGPCRADDAPRRGRRQAAPRRCEGDRGSRSHASRPARSRWRRWRRRRWQPRSRRPGWQSRWRRWRLRWRRRAIAAARVGGGGNRGGGGGGFGGGQGGQGGGGGQSAPTGRRPRPAAQPRPSDSAPPTPDAPASNDAPATGGEGQA